MKGLSAMQKRFADLLMTGMSQVDAAEQAGYKGDKDTLYSTASKLVRNDKIIAYRAELAKKDPLVWGRDELQRFWTKTASQSTEETKDRLAASKLLGSAQGVFVTKVQADVNMSSASRDELLEGLPEAIRALAPNKETRERIAAVLAEMEQGENG